MSVGPRTPASVNVLAGWLAVPVPPIGKHRRRPYRKTARQQTTPEVIRRLEAAGCQPRQVDERTWVALCPTCRAEGRDVAVEIRRADDGTLLLACVEAHERRRVA